ncbi:MAG TPA: c-type cytochrome domain-containing protein [Pirellula sp.]|nr:c-type cytochrome domain-containing protein [Pirellula sp.]
MKTPFLLLSFYLHSAVVTGACWAQASSPSDDLFETHVRPILTKRCYACHRRKAEAALRLDSLDGMLKGGDSGPAIQVGDSTNSLLWRVVSGAHSNISMPPDEPLDDEEIRILERWIDGGAHWPKTAVQLRTNPDAYGISRVILKTLGHKSLAVFLIYWEARPSQQMASRAVDCNWLVGSRTRIIH